MNEGTPNAGARRDGRRPGPGRRGIGAAQGRPLARPILIELPGVAECFGERIWRPDSSPGGVLYSRSVEFRTARERTGESGNRCRLLLVPGQSLSAPARSGSTRRLTPLGSPETKALGSPSAVRHERRGRGVRVLFVREIHVDQALILLGDGFRLGHRQPVGRLVDGVPVLLQGQVVLLRELDRGVPGQAHGTAPVLTAPT